MESTGSGLNLLLSWVVGVLLLGGYAPCVSCEGMVNSPSPIAGAPEVSVGASLQWSPPDGATSFSLRLRQLCPRRFAPSVLVISTTTLTQVYPRLLFGDMDQNGYLDISVSVASSTGRYSLMNSGGGRFSLVEAGGGPVTELVDWNADGVLDTVGFSGQEVRIRLGNGDGTFSEGYPVLEYSRSS